MGDGLNRDEIEVIISRVDRKTRGKEICVYCGNLNWFILDQQSGSSVIPLSNGRTVAIYSLGCTNCGFVRQHLRGVIDDEVKAEVDFGPIADREEP